MGEQPLSPAASPTSSPAPAPAPAPASAPAKITPRPRKLRKLSSPTSTPTPTPQPNQLLLLRPLPRLLTAPGELSAGLAHLRAADPLLAHAIDTLSPPDFRNFLPPFLSLTRSILQQQLSIKASSSICSRFVALCGGESLVSPSTVLALTPHQLRQIGVSGRKATYLHDLARKYHNNILSDRIIVSLDDKSLFSMLTMVKGIGAWSTHMFMIFSLHRPDVLPVGDIGVRRGVHMLYGLEEVPRPSQMERLCERWRPYRSIGACYMWRLLETKVPPTMAGNGAMPIAGMIGSAEGTEQHHPQFMDPIQMLPNIG